MNSIRSAAPVHPTTLSLPIPTSTTTAIFGHMICTGDIMCTCTRCFLLKSSFMNKFSLGSEYSLSNSLRNAADPPNQALLPNILQAQPVRITPPTSPLDSDLSNNSKTSKRLELLSPPAKKLKKSS